MDSDRVNTLKSTLVSKTDAELFELWKSNDTDRKGELSKALRQLILERGHKLPKRLELTDATNVDIALCVIMPMIGMILGVLALAGGEHRRGSKMLTIGAVSLAVFIALVRLT